MQVAAVSKLINSRNEGRTCNEFDYAIDAGGIICFLLHS